MPDRNFPDWLPGEPIDPEEYQRVDRLAQAGNRAYFNGAEEYEIGEGGTVGRFVGRSGHWARLTAFDAVLGAYAWAQVVRDPDTHAWTLLEGGLTGTVGENAARPANPTSPATATETTGDVVWLTPDEDGEDWTWENRPGGVLTKTADFGVGNTHYEVLFDVDASGGARTVTLPPNVQPGFRFWVRKADASSNSVSVSDSTQSIDGGASGVPVFITEQNTAYEFYYLGAGKWSVLASNRFGINLRDFPNTVTYARQTTAEVDKTNGLTLDFPIGAAGPRIGINAAAGSQRGVVNELAQQFDGQKTFTSAPIIVESGTFSHLYLGAGSGPAGVLEWHNISYRLSVIARSGLGDLYLFLNNLPNQIEFVTYATSYPRFFLTKSTGFVEGQTGTYAGLVFQSGWLVGGAFSGGGGGMTVGDPVGSGTAYSLLLVDGSGNLSQITPSTSGLALVSQGSGTAPSYGQVDTPGVADLAITTPKIADANITTAKLADSAATTAKINDGAVTTAKIANDAVTDAQVAAANKDGTAATPSLRTLGTGTQQAAAGDDARLSDARTPTGSAGGDLGGSYPNPTVSIPLARSIKFGVD